MDLPHICLVTGLLLVGFHVFCKNFIPASISNLNGMIAGASPQSFTNLSLREYYMVSLNSDQILSHLLEIGTQPSDIQKPSMEFMLGVFKHLLNGEELPAAVGHVEEGIREHLSLSDTIRSVTANVNEAPTRLVYSIPPIPVREHIKMAELRFHDNLNWIRKSKVTLKFRKGHRILANTQLKYDVVKTAANLSRCVIIFNNLIRKILNSFHGNITIEINIRTIKEDDELSSMNNNSVPILIVYSQDNEYLTHVTKIIEANKLDTKLTRNKRASNENSRMKQARKQRNKWQNGGVCKMYDFKVDFDLIGWGPWIIHPKTFNSRVCHGQCPSSVSHEFAPGNHAMLQTLMRIKRPNSAPELCCVATKLNPLSMLYFEYNDIVVRYHQDMVVTECGCR